MFAKPGPTPDVHLTRVHRWSGLGVFVAFVVIGLVLRAPATPSLAIPAALVAAFAGALAFLVQSRLLLGYAAVATVGMVLTVSAGGGAIAGSSNVGWFTLCILAGWCMLSGGIRVGLIYWAACLLLFGVQWLVVESDPGWGNWAAGVTFTFLAAILVRHQLVLVERLREAQAGLAERSRAEERNRIARELHDVIAHSLTVSLLHVSSARLAVEHDPADAARSLAEAERLGRQSLAEVRATMGMTQSDAAGGIAPPVPGVGDLDRLVDQVSDAGVDVRLVVDGDLGTLPATTASTVYRIVQEALTNAAKHAVGAPVVVAVTADGERVDVSVDSAGLPGQGAGMGVAGMRERAEAVGGTCSAGPGGSGWLVRASLPVATFRGVGAP